MAHLLQLDQLWWWLLPLLMLLMRDCLLRKMMRLQVLEEAMELLEVPLLELEVVAVLSYCRLGTAGSYLIRRRSPFMVCHPI